MIKEKGHKKSLSLNNDIFEKSVIKNLNNENKVKCEQANKLENKIINLNKENLLKLLIMKLMIQNLKNSLKKL